MAVKAGTTATIKCATNHILVGSGTLKCQDDGSWSSDIPQCNKSKCKIHSSIAQFTCLLLSGNL